AQWRRGCTGGYLEIDGSLSKRVRTALPGNGDSACDRKRRGTVGRGAKNLAAEIFPGDCSQYPWGFCAARVWFTESALQHDQRISLNSLAVQISFDVTQR